MIGRMSCFTTHFVSRRFPDPLIFAILLTLLTFAITLWLTPRTPISMVKMRSDNFWNLLASGMQMALIIVTGHALVSSAPVRSLLHTAVPAVKTPAQGVMLVTLFGSATYIINWGFGLIVGAMFAREVARRVPGSDYPLLIACAYIGFPIWGGGFSGSAPLLAATPNSLVERIVGLIPMGDTLFSSFNIFITVALIVVMLSVARMMMPRPSDAVNIDPKLLTEEADFQKQLPKDIPLSERLEESHIPTLTIDASNIAYLAMHFSEHGFNITINTVDLMFMIASLLLHKAPVAHMHAISAVVRNTTGILVQFPFYAGIQLVMEHSGLGGLITESFTNVANKGTFPIMTFPNSALINFVVPSGGGYWVIRGPFVMPATQTLGADLGGSIMAIAHGEQWTSVVQPFWALPAPAIAGLDVRDTTGYCITALLFPGVIFVIGLAPFWRQSYRQKEHKMKSCAIVSAVRTVVSSFNGSLASTNTIDLGATVTKAAIERVKIDSLHVDEAIMGNVLQAGLGQNSACQALLESGLIKTVYEFTVNEVCDSGLRSVTLVIQATQAGQAQSIVAEGMENMSLAPYLLDARARSGYRPGDGQVYNIILRDSLMHATHGYHTGITAGNVAKEYGITREMRNELALHSQRKTTVAIGSGAFIAEIAPVSVTTQKEASVPSQDELLKADLTAEALGTLHPALDKAGTVTAGNASGTNNGVAVLVIVEESSALTVGLIPLAHIKNYISDGVPLALMSMGPIPVTQKALQLVGLQLAGTDLIEANKAFAAQFLAVGKTLGFKPEKVNVNDGTIVLGYPIGASGVRILVTLLRVMQARDKTLGLATPCIDGDQGITIVIE